MFLNWIRTTLPTTTFRASWIYGRSYHSMKSSFLMRSSHFSPLEVLRSPSMSLLRTSRTHNALSEHTACFLLTDYRKISPLTTGTETETLPTFASNSLVWHIAVIAFSVHCARHGNNPLTDAQVLNRTLYVTIRARHTIKTPLARTVLVVAVIQWVILGSTAALRCRQLIIQISCSEYFQLLYGHCRSIIIVTYLYYVHSCYCTVLVV